ncbi:DUF1918 domain-containing protein [Catellatospora sp. NPDC049609]|uniref:DUF1918 domain-containing protein n=1 Tax=Catellatospora sp. NPDC049609 TaxID=3155505 RepID=UPI0034122017
MQATEGDAITIHGKTVGARDQHGEIIKVRGPHGGPPYRVRFNDGHEGLVYPGPDAVIEPRHQHR